MNKRRGEALWGNVFSGKKAMWCYVKVVCSMVTLYSGVPFKVVTTTITRAKTTIITRTIQQKQHRHTYYFYVYFQTYESICCY